MAAKPAGTAHADAHILGPTAASLDCGVPINDGPLHIVAKAALRALTTWLTTGEEICAWIRMKPGRQALEQRLLRVLAQGDASGDFKRWAMKQLVVAGTDAAATSFGSIAAMSSSWIGLYTCGPPAVIAIG
mgnify:CR=1 FL=1